MSITPSQVYRDVAAFLRQHAPRPPALKDRARKQGSFFDVVNASVGQWGAGHIDDDEGNLNRLAVFNPTNNIPELRPTNDSASFVDEFNGASIEVHWRVTPGGAINRVGPTTSGMEVGGSQNPQFLIIATLSQPWNDPRVDLFIDAYDDQETISLIYNATVAADGTLESGYRLKYDRAADVATLLRYDAGVPTELGSQSSISALGEVFGLSLRRNTATNFFIANIDTGGAFIPVLSGATPAESTYTSGEVGVCFEGVDAIVGSFVVRRSPN